MTVSSPVSSVQCVPAALRGGVCAAVLCLLAACQHAPVHVADDADDDRDRRPAAVVVTVPTGVFQGWQPRPMPSKRWADFEAVTQDGQPGLQVRANGTLSLLHLPLESTRTDASKVSWSWWLEKELPDADLARPMSAIRPCA